MIIKKNFSTIFTLQRRELFHKREELDKRYFKSKFEKYLLTRKNSDVTLILKIDEYPGLQIILGKSVLWCEKLPIQITEHILLLCAPN